MSGSVDEIGSASLGKGLQKFPLFRKFHLWLFRLEKGVNASAGAVKVTRLRLSRPVPRSRCLTEPWVLPSVETRGRAGGSTRLYPLLPVARALGSPHPWLAPALPSRPIGGQSPGAGGQSTSMSRQQIPGAARRAATGAEAWPSRSTPAQEHPFRPASEEARCLRTEQWGL